MEDINNLLLLVRGHVGKGIYRRGASIENAPNVVDCRTLVRWAYCQVGISLSPEFLSWITMGVPVVRSELMAGDIVFTGGYCNQMVPNVGAVGHVGFVADGGTIIHATNHVGIEEISIDLFFSRRVFCCARRIVPQHH